MSSHSPFASRPKRLRFNSRLRRYRLPALALTPAAVLLVCAVTAAASCTFLLKWGSTGLANGQFSTPRGIAVDSAGNVYVAEANGNRVQKFDSGGNFLIKFGVPGEVGGGFVNANKLAVDSAGYIYVTDSQPDRNTNLVQKFDSTGAFVLGWGTKGGGNGQFFGAGGVAIDTAGNIYVTDTGGNRVQKFTNTGTFLAAWGSAGAGNGQFNSPQGIAIDASNNVYVADTGNNRIQKFTTAGAYVSQWGTSGSANGEFSSPQGLSVDSAGDVYVADSGNSRIQKFSSAGAFIESCGIAGSGDGEFSAPADVAADLSGNFYVADTGNDRVQKFGTAAAPPVADAGPDQTVECTGTTTSVTLDGTASTAGSGTINSYTWTEGATTLGTGATLVVSLSDGPHTITLTVTDTGGGSDTEDVLINIVDTTPPEINCPADVIVMLPPNSTATSLVVNYPAVTATDACSTSVTVESDPPSGSVFPLGETTVNATAEDEAGLTSECSFKVKVLYDFTGFFQPVDNLPVLNVVQAGRSVPVKFSLSGYKGLDIFAAGSPSSGPIACSSSDPAVDLEETVTAGGSTLSYNSTTDQYNYVWKTDPGWAGTCRQLVVTLNDGSVHRANFKFR